MLFWPWTRTWVRCLAARVEQNCHGLSTNCLLDISKDKWEKMTAANNWNSVELRDNRYNHIVHMVSAANGAEVFYSTEVSWPEPLFSRPFSSMHMTLYVFVSIGIFICTQDHACRSEGVEHARELDHKAAAAWVGHPYFDVIDNSTDFDTKINRMLECVAQKLSIDTGDRLLRTSRKLKFLGKVACVLLRILFTIALSTYSMWRTADANTNQIKSRKTKSVEHIDVLPYRVAVVTWRGAERFAPRTPEAIATEFNGQQSRPNVQ